MELRPDGIKTSNMLAIVFRLILILNAELREMPKTAKLKTRRNENYA